MVYTDWVVVFVLLAFLLGLVMGVRLGGSAR